MPAASCGLPVAMKKLNYQVKEQMVTLASACFWYWGGFHSFLNSCGVPRRLITKYPKGTFSKYDVMRNIIDDLDEVNEHNVIQNIVSGFYKLQSPIDKDNLDIEKARRLLQEFRESVGNDPIERAVQERESIKKRAEAKQKIDKTQSQIKRLEELNKFFLSIFSSSELTPQKKGFELEKIFYELLSIEEFEFTKPYRIPGEQIDGHFKYEKFDYLVEVKWEKDPAKQEDLSVFDGKIRGKAQSTRGFFLAMNGYDDNAIGKYSGDSPRIILMDGRELMNILEYRISFYDCIKFKVDALVRYGDIYRRDKG